MNNFDKEFQSVGENNLNEVGKKSYRGNMTEKEIKEFIGFAKFKNRLFSIRLIKTILTTLAFAFIACGVVLILTKLDVWNISPWFSLLFMALAGAITFPCVFLPLSFTDKKLAYKLDEEFSLKEKMHTSLANLDNNSPMSILLRQDLKEATEKIEARKIKARGLPVYIAVAVIGLATLITGLAIKQEKPTPPPPPPIDDAGWSLSDEQALAIEELILAVDKSNMVSPAKEELVKKMEDLLVSLKATDDYGVACDLVLACVEDMDEITYKTGSRGAIYEAIKSKDTEFTRELARMLTRTDETRYFIKLHDALNSLKHENEKLEEPTAEQQEAMKNDTITLLSFASIDVISALEESGVDSSDSLYSLLYSLITFNKNGIYGVGTIGEKLGNLKYGWASIQLDSLKESMIVNNIYAELARQNENYSVGYGASDGLRELFDIAKPQREDLTEEEKGEGEGSGAEEDDDQSGAGGYGPGLILGTDELIFDEEHKQTIITLEIYQKYEEIMKKSDFTPEERKAIEQYFELLLKGYEEGEEENGK